MIRAVISSDRKRMMVYRDNFPPLSLYSDEGEQDLIRIFADMFATESERNKTKDPYALMFAKHYITGEHDDKNDPTVLIEVEANKYDSN